MTRNENEDDTPIDVTSTPAPQAPVSTAILAADGLTCGVLEPAIAAHLRRLAPGEVLEIHSDRPEATDAIAAWVSLAGHTLVPMAHDSQHCRGRYFVRKKLLARAPRTGEPS